MFKSKPMVTGACVLAFVLVVASVVFRYINTEKINGQLSYVGGVDTSNQMDKIPDSTSNTASSSDLFATPEINQTDLVSKKLFASYMVLQNSGNLNAQSASDLADSISSDISADVTDSYQISDLIIIASSTPSNLRDYANKFWAIRQKYINLYKKNPLGSLNFTADPTDPSFADGFVATGNLYIKMATDLSKLPVPEQLADLHLKLLNNYVASGLDLKKLQQVNSDPIATIGGLSSFSQYSDYEGTILSIMAQYFSASGIIFNSNESGAGWNTI